MEMERRKIKETFFKQIHCIITMNYLRNGVRKQFQDEYSDFHTKTLRCSEENGGQGMRCKFLLYL